MTKSLTQLRIDSQLSISESIERTKEDNGSKTVFLLIGRTVNQDLAKGDVIISALLCKYSTKNEAEYFLPKFQETFGNEWIFWIL